MIKFTKTGAIYTFSIIIFIVFQIFINKYKVVTENTEYEENTQIVENKENNQEEKEIEIWQIEIPKISLNAKIAEGTTKDILNQYVGHFSETQKEEGNIGLAAHNRGYEVNYFKDLKMLKKGDEIKYIHNQYEKIYEVEKCRIIKDTDLYYLENTEDNRLTLITCVENQPEYRRCIQAVEKEEDRY